MQSHLVHGYRHEGAVSVLRLADDGQSLKAGVQQDGVQRIILGDAVGQFERCQELLSAEPHLANRAKSRTIGQAASGERGVQRVGGHPLRRGLPALIEIDAVATRRPSQSEASRRVSQPGVVARATGADHGSAGAFLDVDAQRSRTCQTGHSCCLFLF